MLVERYWGIAIGRENPYLMLGNDVTEGPALYAFKEDAQAALRGMDAVENRRSARRVVPVTVQAGRRQRR